MVSGIEGVHPQTPLMHVVPASLHHDVKLARLKEGTLLILIGQSSFLQANASSAISLSYVYIFPPLCQSPIHVDRTLSHPHAP
jgi:hypothetical protein